MHAIDPLSSIARMQASMFIEQFIMRFQSLNVLENGSASQFSFLTYTLINRLSHRCHQSLGDHSQA